jgi:peptide/nickel transport system substrate-binding protein
MRKRRMTLLCGLLLACLLWASPTLAASTLILADETPPTTMDPAADNSDSTCSVLVNVFDGLLAREGKEGKIVPGLAEKYEHPDAVTWKFILRKGVKFHNGDPLTSADVKFSFERLADPKLSKWLETGQAIASIETPDERTIIFKTKHPTPWFVSNVHQIFIVSKKDIESRDAGDVGVKPMGTGPYKFVEWVKGSHLKFTANEAYWGGAPKIKEVELKIITEPATRYAALASGSVDLVAGLPLEMFEQIKQNPKLEILSRPSRRVIYLALGSKAGTPLADVRVRRAIYLAINEDEIIQKVMQGKAYPAAQLADSASTGFNPTLKRLPFDPDKSKALLKEAGYENGFEITLAGPNDRYVNDAKIAEAAVQYLNKVGIKAKLDVKPKAVFFPEVTSGDKFDFYLLGWLDGAYDSARGISTNLATYNKEKGWGGWNGARFSAPEIDALMDQAAVMVDLAERDKILQKAHVVIQEKVALIPLHYGIDLYGLVKDRGVKFTPRPERWLVYKEIEKN